MAWQHEPGQPAEKLPLAIEVHAQEVVLGEPLVSDAAERRARKRQREESKTNYHVASLVLTIIIVGLIIGATLTTDDGARRLMSIIAAFAGFVYLINAFCDSETFNCLWNANSSHGAVEKLLQLQRTAPEITACVQCYHYKDRRSSTHTRADGTTEQRSESSHERINTHHATSEFQFEHWRDVSEPPYAVTRPFDIVRLHLRIEIKYGTEATARAHAAVCQALRDLHANRDAHFEFEEKVEVEGMVPHMLLLPEDGSLRPWWMYWQWYAASVFVFLNWPYRMALEASTVKVIYVLAKEVYIAEP
eukprot:TRINITY_DN1456_c0_g1_i3.p1 TRINITY_DN1456_c0_g1~~TRINITY_DN1456_c0_g1_i3.p1  ORF type:complete len:304 (-),score=87.88 TRINITY_DN1456_c0_g1_i3:26-937(-)